MKFFDVSKTIDSKKPHMEVLPAMIKQGKNLVVANTLKGNSKREDSPSKYDSFTVF